MIRHVHKSESSLARGSSANVADLGPSLALRLLLQLDPYSHMLLTKDIPPV